MRGLAMLVGVAAFTVVFGTAGVASAQEGGDSSAGEAVSHGNDRADGRFVGISGGVIVGAEAVMAIQAAIGVDTLWPYLVFPVLGAAGGGVGGYFLEKASVPGAVALLVTGIALSIPTAIATTSAFAYNPEEESGALKGEAQGAGQLSFELPPDDTGPQAGSDDGAVTEVEAQPDVGPPGRAPLPPPSGDGAPSAGDGEAPERSTTSEEGAADTPPPTSRHSPGPSRRGAAPASVGALVRVDASGNPGLGIPTPAIRPAVLYDADGRRLASRGIEVMLPLLHIDLP